MATSFAQIKQITDKIEGWLHDEEAELLYSLAKEAKGNGAILEIGSWCGKSIVCMSLPAVDAGFEGKIYSIDPFLTSKDEPNGKYETFLSNLEQNGLLKRVCHIKEKSQIAGENFEENIEILFIDGFHKYDYVKKDFELFFPKLIQNGYVCIHDICYYEGPTVLVEELVQNDNFRMIKLCQSTLLAQKVNKLSESDLEDNKKILELIKSKSKCCSMIS